MDLVKDQCSVGMLNSCVLSRFFRSFTCVQSEVLIRMAESMLDLAKSIYPPQEHGQAMSNDGAVRVLPQDNAPGEGGGGNMQ